MSAGACRTAGTCTGSRCSCGDARGPADDFPGVVIVRVGSRIVPPSATRWSLVTVLQPLRPIPKLRLFETTSRIQGGHQAGRGSTLGHGA